MSKTFKMDRNNTCLDINVQHLQRVLVSSFTHVTLFSMGNSQISAIADAVVQNRNANPNPNLNPNPNTTNNLNPNADLDPDLNPVNDR